MNRYLIAACSLVVASVLGSNDLSSNAASAQGFGAGVGFVPFGFYQPYGAQYSTSIRTPPYFATNPPVYYGARHARPYGLSPFAAPPQVQAGADYHSRLRSDFLEPNVATPGPASTAPCCNPYIHGSNAKPGPAKIGAVQNNPFVEPSERLAKNEA
ncbi:hypothetical protein [Rubripirellula tenax]|nr:hypothetical protein [Rubripirellula tenax]